MNEKKSFNEKLDNFFAGKGFYIVLFLCVAIIGVSTYFLLTNGRTDVDEGLAQMLPQSSTEVFLPPEHEPEAPVLEQQEEEVPVIDEENEGTSEVDVWSEQEAEVAAGAQFIWPVDGSIDLPYSVAALIYNPKLGDWRVHDGVDIAAPLGTQVVSVSAGTVISVAEDGMNGMTVVIEHAGGLRSVYCNLASIPTVYVGDTVMTGEVIGAVGVTAPGETADNPHLCFKMTLEGMSVNPADYLPQK